MLMAHDETSKNPVNVFATSAGHLLVALAGSAGAAAIAAAGASFAATVLGMTTKAAAYGWDDANSLWKRLLADATGQLQVAGYTAATTSNRDEEIDPVDQHDLYEKPLDDSSLGDATVYSDAIDMAHAKNLTIQIIDTPGGAGTNTYTVEISNQDDATAAGSCTYRDITLMLTDDANSHNANYTTHAFLAIPEGLRGKYVRIKRVRSADGGAADGASTIYTRKGP